jgi:uncharacterized membrane protein YhhN
MKFKVISLLYFFIGTIYTIFQDRLPFYPGLVIKALIIPVLMILFMVNIKLLSIRLYNLILAALFFSWAGDVILEFSQKDGGFFIPGLISFLLAHVMYLTVFLKTPGRNSILQHRFYLLIPVLLSGVGLVYYLYDDLGSMRIPVILYAIVIITMVTTALNRIEKVNRESFYMVLAGAILFFISDSGIAINKFSHPFEYSGIIIMSTYIIAQYMIVIGYILQFREKNENFSGAI